MIINDRGRINGKESWERPGKVSHVRLLGTEVPYPDRIMWVEKEFGNGVIRVEIPPNPPESLEHPQEG